MLGIRRSYTKRWNDRNSFFLECWRFFTLDEIRRGFNFTSDVVQNDWTINGDSFLKKFKSWCSSKTDFTDHFRRRRFRVRHASNGAGHFLSYLVVHTSAILFYTAPFINLYFDLLILCTLDPRVSFAFYSAVTGVRNWS